jgi:CheY-like chemotaxis protein
MGRTALHILLVEDHQDCAESTAMLLRFWGHEVEAVRDGPAAVKAAQEQQPDVVLLDIGLPGGMDGWTVAKRISGEASGKKPLLVALTGYGQEDDRRHSDECGLSFHLTKPVDPAQLKVILDKWQVVLSRREAKPEPSNKPGQ